MNQKKLRIALAMIATATPFILQADMQTSTDQESSMYKSGEQIKDSQLQGAYGQSASYNLNNQWDIFLTADFIYWKQSQVLNGAADVATLGTSILNASHSLELAQPGYKPGFQVGLGFNMKGMDNWNLYSEYTWYQNNSSKTVTAGSGEVLILMPVGFEVITAAEKTSKSKLNYNNLNLSLERPFYWGKKLTSNFGCGLRALWLSQHFTSDVSGLDAISLTGGSHVTLSGSATRTLQSKSWALGPRINVDSDWLLGYGFKVLGNAAASVLYTKYTDVSGSFKGDAVLGAHSLQNGSTVSIKNGASALTPILETGLGLGWGSYFGSKDNFHFDLSVGYDFNILWRGIAGGNLFLYGLNIGTRFDF